MIETLRSQLEISQFELVGEVHTSRMRDPFQRRLWTKRGAVMPGSEFADVAPLPAIVRQGRWVVLCPFCHAGGAEMADPEDPRFFCLSCYNAAIGNRWAPVRFPYPLTIERLSDLLDVRSDPDWRNWEPPTTLNELRLQNAAGFHHSWTTPRTWVTSEVISAAIMNTHVRDNFLETATAKATALADMFYASGANALTRLPLGATGLSLISSGGVPTWFNISGLTNAGDLTYGVGSGPNIGQRLAIGNTNDILSVVGGVPVWRSPRPGNVIIKSADESRTSTVSPSGDSELQFPVVSGGVYVAWLFPILFGLTAAGCIGYFQVPSGTTYFHQGISGNSGYQPNVPVSMPIGANSTILGGPPGMGIIRATANGTCYFAWAQGTLNATPSIMKADSMLVWARVN